MSIKKRLIAMSMVAALMLTACSTGEATESVNTETTTDSLVDFDTTSDPTGVAIVLGSNSLGEERGDFIQKMAEEAGFNIEYMNIGGGTLTSRIITEVNNPTINVVWGPTDEQFKAMVAANALVEFSPTWAEEVAGYAEENGHSYTFSVQPKILIANPDIYTEDTVPTSYQELWENEEFHGKYAVPTTFTGNSSRAVIGGILGQYLDPNGELGVSDEGWEAIKMYFDYGYKTPAGENAFENMASGKVPISYIHASGLAGLIESYGVSPIIAYTDLGEPTGANQVGVVANDDIEVVKESMRFAEWLCSAETIGEWAAANGDLVTHPGAFDEMMPLSKEISENYTFLDLDWNTINARMDEWVAKIQLEIY